eukprot:10703109-Karenia_brevis.AAC.1
MDWVIERFQSIFYHLRRLKVRPSREIPGSHEKCSPNDQAAIDELLALIIKEWKESTAERRARWKRSKIADSSSSEEEDAHEENASEGDSNERDAEKKTKTKNEERFVWRRLVL